MKSHLISYDLNRPRKDKDYPEFIEAIKSYSTWWHNLDSTWIVKTNDSAVEIRDMLVTYLDDGDELLVVELTGEGAWAGFKEKGSTWLDNHL